MPYRSANAPHIANLMLRRGDIEARRAQGGQAWGQAAQNIGRTLGDFLQQRKDYQDAAPDRAYQEERRKFEREGMDATRAERARVEAAREIIAAHTDPRTGKSDPRAITAALTQAGLPDLARDYEAEATAKEQGLMARGILQAHTKPDGRLDTASALQTARNTFAGQLPESLAWLETRAAEEQPRLGAIDPTQSWGNLDTGEILRPGTPAGPTPAQAETARHNRELERIATLTSGRADATAAETARHNREMESTARISASRDRDPTQGQYVAGKYAGRIEQAERIFEALAPNIAEMSLPNFYMQTESWFARPTFQSDEVQSYMQAASNFINATLRLESGAVINPSEFAEARRQYLPVSGDSPATLQQKSANRKYVFETMKRQAGAAYEPPISAPSGGPQIGEQRMIQGVLGEWDGTQWLEVP